MFWYYVLVHVIAQAGFNFTSRTENGIEIVRGAAKCNFSIIATASGIYPKISLRLSQINTIPSFVKVKYLIFKPTSR